jgi:hypothetical protein
MTVEATIHRVPNSVPARYLVRFRGFSPTDANLTRYRDQCFSTLRAAREFANRRMFNRE